ncbi:glutaredoxin family protein [Peptoniphilaceae bacterium SGI.137]|nr:glutaredoxin family protein [Peptoniphilaceae bacterium]MCI6660461.1 glutaredoxin family protein [Peptoniphilaceae bacterium]MDD7542992.1 glutaredoxin family protein [Peptoniphilaceae bacterium]MDY3987465.1 glutaredoxin family protein [Peptoniphilaceae bacterium]MDY4196544.1 glutaredoxin family protein [Peptoniphilaceae bacterium]
MAQVTIYTSPTCVHCKAAKAYMDENGISYEEKDVMSDQDARKWMMDRGYRGVPVLQIGEEEIVGFDPKKMQELLKK